MPIIDEMKSLSHLEAAGFSHKQAKAIVEVTESGHQDGFARFVEALDGHVRGIYQRMELMEQRLHGEIQSVGTEMQGVRADLLKEQRDQVLRFAALITLIVSVVGSLIGAALKWL